MTSAKLITIPSEVIRDRLSVMEPESPIGNFIKINDELELISFAGLNNEGMAIVRTVPLSALLQQASERGRARSLFWASHEHEVVSSDPVAIALAGHPKPFRYEPVPDEAKPFFRIWDKVEEDAVHFYALGGSIDRPHVFQGLMAAAGMLGAASSPEMTPAIITGWEMFFGPGRQLVGMVSLTDDYPGRQARFINGSNISISTLVKDGIDTVEVPAEVEAAAIFRRAMP